MPITDAQKKAITAAGHPLFIQAGAGTGKTFTLTNRLAYGLSKDSGPLIRSVQNLLVITFTNKAAGELMGRVRAELRRRGLMAESLSVDAAWISTIHSMCRRILLTHAFEAGIDPGAELLTDEETSDLLGAAVEDMLQQRAACSELRLLLGRHGVGEVCDLVSGLALKLQLAPQGEASFVLGPQDGAAGAAAGSGDATAGPGARALRTQVVELVARLGTGKAELDELGLPEGKKTYQQNYDTICAALEALSAALGAGEDEPPAASDAPAAPGAAAADGSAPEPPQSVAALEAALAACKSLRGGSFKEPYKGIFAELSGALKEAKAQAAAAFTREELAAALRLAQGVCARHGALKSARGALDTNDLLIETYRLLEREPRIAAEYRARFDSIMVDEFQDTDRLQVGIIGRFCDEQLTTLATVGDAQQSIYGFRGADLEVYREVRADMARRSPVADFQVELAENFRSHPGILGFVEQIFSRPEFFGGEFLQVKAGPDNKRAHNWIGADDPRVEVFLSAGQQNPENKRSATGVEALRAADAAHVAAEFERLHAAGAHYGQMAILMQSVKGGKAGAYLRELRRRGIPCVVSGGSDYYTLPEVRVLAMFLRFLEDRDDDEALFEVLASPLFDLADDDLLALATVNKQELGIAPDEARSKVSLFDALAHQARRIPAGTQDPLVGAHALLCESLSAAGREPLSVVVAGAVRKSGWEAQLARADVEGQAVQANIQRFCDLLDDFESAHGRSVLAAAEHFRAMCELAEAGTGARGKPGAMVAEGNAAVQIMTIHSSKGLEFPIVAVAEFEKSSTSHGGIAADSLTEDGVEYLALSDYSDSKTREYLRDEQNDPGSFAAASDQAGFCSHALRLAQQRAAEEEQRLLYVALTRARDLLILAVHDKAYASKGELAGGLTKDVLEAVYPDGLPQGRSVTTLPTGAQVQLQVTEVPFDAPAAPAPAAAAGVDALLVREHVTPQPQPEPLVRSRIAESRLFESYSSLARAASENAATAQADAISEVPHTAGPEGIAGSLAQLAADSSSASLGPRSAAPDAAISSVGVSSRGVHAGLFASEFVASGAADSPDALSELSHAAGSDDFAGASADDRRPAAGADAAMSQVASDDPAATSAFGSAFHLVAQWVAETGIADAAAIARRCAAAQARFGLDAPAAERLSAAVAAWVGSARFAQAMACPERHAEYAFCVDTGGVPLEGYLDLLCLGQATSPDAASAVGASAPDAASARRRALVIDYKTGTSGQGDPVELRARYALQARAYAYAVLASGLADEVELAFVRPEAGMEEVVFRFTPADL